MKTHGFVGWLALVALGCTGSSVVGGPTPTPDVAVMADDSAAAPTDAPRDVGSDAGVSVDAAGDVGARPDVTDVGAPSDVIVDVEDIPQVSTDVPRDASVAPTDDGIDPTPASIDTVAPATARAGDTLSAACLLRNREGALVATPPGAIVEVRYAPMALVRSVGGVAVAARPGTVTSTCALMGTALVDPTPASTVIFVNVPAVTRAVVDRSTIAAGESVNVQCEVYDREGNLLTGLPTAPTVAARPIGNGNTVVDQRVTLQRAGETAVTCIYPGASADATTVTVRPLGAVSLDLTRAPTSSRYGLGELIIFEGVPRDRYRNVVPDVPVTYVSVPAGVSDRGLPNHLRFGSEGSYAVTARATGEGGVALRADVTVVVDDQGPVTECLSPAHASMLDLAPGATLHITGRTNDFAGVQRLEVRRNESDAITELHPDSAGNWSYDIPAARFGINYIDIESVDQFGNSSLENCAFLVSNRWSPERGALAGAMGFYLGPAAMDDGLPYSPVTSLADLMSAVVNSAALRAQLDGLMRAIDPIYDNRCLVNLGIFGGCQGFVTIHYRSSDFRGPNSTGLQLLDGGLRMTARFQNVRLLVHIDSSLGPYDGAVVISTVDAAASFDVALTAGVPGARLRPGTASVTVGAVTVEIPSLDASLVSFVNAAASGQLRTALQTSLQQVVVAQFGAALDGVFGSLGVTGAAGSFPVRGFDGSTTVDLNLATTLAALDVTAQRFHLGISTTVTGPTTRTTTSRGVALPPGTTVDPALSSPATLSLNIGVFNQLLHAMWRAGLFDTVSPNVTILGFTGPLRTRFNLPPVASFAPNGDLLVDLGGMDYDLQMLDPPVNTRIGVRLRSTPYAEGGQLRFGAFNLDELHLAPRGVPLSGAVRSAAVVYARPYLQEITGESLARALPSIPLPTFAIPPALAAYGLPSGAQLGIVRPALTVASPYFVLGGAFGDTR